MTGNGTCIFGVKHLVIWGIYCFNFRGEKSSTTHHESSEKPEECINFLEVFYSYTPQKLTWNLKNDGCFHRNLLFVGAHFQVNHVTFSGVFHVFQNNPKTPGNPEKPTLQELRVSI